MHLYHSVFDVARNRIIKLEIQYLNSNSAVPMGFTFSKEALMGNIYIK